MWGAGVGVVLAAASSALINELQAGWPWWVAAGLVVLASAVLTSWLAASGQSAVSSQSADGQSTVSGQQTGPSVRIGPGGFLAGRNIKIRGGVKTAATGGDPATASGPHHGMVGPDLEVQGFVAGNDLIIGGDVDTTGSDGRP